MPQGTRVYDLTYRPERHLRPQHACFSEDFERASTSGNKCRHLDDRSTTSLFGSFLLSVLGFGVLGGSVRGVDMFSDEPFPF
eukprot:4699122-Pyramimonas_sp.AAC.2